LMMEQR